MKHNSNVSDVNRVIHMLMHATLKLTMNICYLQRFLQGVTQLSGLRPLPDPDVPSVHRG